MLNNQPCRFKPNLSFNAQRWAELRMADRAAVAGAIAPPTATPGEVLRHHRVELVAAWLREYKEELWPMVLKIFAEKIGALLWQVLQESRNGN
jgi:hypothetical protein